VTSGISEVMADDDGPLLFGLGLGGPLELTEDVNWSQESYRAVHSSCTVSAVSSNPLTSRGAPNCIIAVSLSSRNSFDQAVRCSNDLLRYHEHYIVKCIVLCGGISDVCTRRCPQTREKLANRRTLILIFTSLEVSLTVLSATSFKLWNL
jgi:hypothetical protein